MVDVTAGLPTLAVALGGLIGSVARYWLNALIQARVATVFPLGILIVNVLGCFVLGLVTALLAARSGVRPEITLFLTTGLCGGFTTMSAFSFDTLWLLQHGHAGLAVLNLVATLLACLAAVWGGQAVGGAS
jgi:CrcB protein